MTKYETLDRLLAGEPVEPTDDLVALAALAEEVEAIFTAAEPTKSASRRGLNASLEAFREAAPGAYRPSRTRRMATRALVAAAMLVALPAVGWAASEDALPGDVLYPVKRAFEQIQLVMAGSPVDEGVVLLEQAAERLGEAAQATALGRDEASSLAVAGYLEAMGLVDQAIAEARSMGIDVSALVAIARDLAERHQALLDALLGDGPAPGGQPAVEATPRAGRRGGDTEPDGSRAKDDRGRDDAGAKGGKAKGGKAKGGKGKGGKAGEEASGGSGSQDSASGPGRAGGAPYGKAKGHAKHGSPPHGKAKGHAKHGSPPRAKQTS